MIGDKGAQYLAEALRQNEVISPFSFSHSTVHYVTQTLTTMDLRFNQIGSQGAEHLANALEQNKVTFYLFLIFSFYHSLTGSHRHLSH